MKDISPKNYKGIGGVSSGAPCNVTRDYIVFLAEKMKGIRRPRLSMYQSAV